MYNNILNDLNLDYLLVCSTNEFLVEYPALSENARYTLTGFSGSTGDALLTKDNITHKLIMKRKSELRLLN